MNAKHYDVICFIGRVEPPHRGHVSTILKGFDHADHVLVVLGSHDSPRTIKNPWTTEERMQMILASIPAELHPRIGFVGAVDYMYNDAEWLTEVTKSIRSTATLMTGKQDPSLALIAYSKDDTTYYLNYFKFLDIVPVDEVRVSDDGPSLSSTKIRELYFEGYLDFIKHVCPAGVIDFLKEFYHTDAYRELKVEYDDAVKYQKMYENVPHGYTNFLTSDSVVIQSGHVLLIQRGDAPGKNLWAIPGGHLNVSETFLDGAIRELREETGIKVPEKVLRGSIFHDKIFDHPDRSLRCRIKGKKGRSVTVAFGFKLDDSAELPRVKGQDDAKHAQWFPFDKIEGMRSQIFEDHFDIINYMINRL